MLQPVRLINLLLFIFSQINHYKDLILCCSKTIGPAGSFSRTAVNYSAGCETLVSNIVMAITVVVSLELFTKLLYYTPIAILASIILSALPGLINLNEIYHIWKVDKWDFLACIGAFLGVLFASVEIGLMVAVRPLLFRLPSYNSYFLWLLTLFSYAYLKR